MPATLGGRGFTLAEVLLALGLTVVIMATVSTAISTYARLSHAGRAEVEQARLAQAILRKMERDIRSVVFRPPQLAAAPAGQAADSTSAAADPMQADDTGSTGFDLLGAGSPDAMLVDTTAAYASSDVGLFGDATTLIVHVSRPSRELNYAPLFDGDAAGSRSSDLQSVSWFLAVANGGGLQGAVGNVASGGSVRTSRESGVQGLARLEGDRLAMNLADTAGDSAAMAEAAEVVAEEVNFLAFRYFDGAAWLDVWDSQQMGALPRAVEIIIGFEQHTETKDARADALARLGAEQIGQTYRLVVSIPMSP